MHDRTRLRELARRCRKSAGSSTDPATVEQLRRWALELAEAADRAEWGAFDPGDPEITRTLFEIEDEGR
jgi:hypothetical protein